MQDLNNLAYFVKVVDYRGFAPAARALGMQKSKLSRRIAQLEEQLGVRLIQRSTRRFAVTEIGHSYYQHCQAMLVEAEAAQQAIDQASTEPLGLVRLACPPGLLAYRMSQAIAEYMTLFPKVEVRLKAFNRPVDVILEGYDLVITTQAPTLETASLAMRKLGEMGQCLVVAPGLAGRNAIPAVPTDLQSFPALATSAHPTANGEEGFEWRLGHANGSVASIPFRPRLVTDDLSSLRAAALAGIGVVQMPTLMIETDVRQGRLIEILPDWKAAPIPVYAVFPSRRGLLPSVRTLLEHLAEDCAPYRDGSSDTP